MSKHIKLEESIDGDILYLKNPSKTESVIISLNQLNQIIKDRKLVEACGIEQ